MTIALFASGLCAFILVMNIISMLIMARRCRARSRALPPPKNAPPVSIVRPLRGVEPYSEETIRATFMLNYPDYEVLFCVQNPGDPIIEIVERIKSEFPHRSARLLVGDDKISVNPKLNNCFKGWNAAAHDFIILADSNALAPPDYIQTMLAAFKEDTALTISMPIGSRPLSFWAAVECAILNTFQARWQYGAEAIGIGFAQGKNMMWRRDVLDRVGGIRALAAEVAEDAAATKVIRAQNLGIRLVDMPFEQPLGARTAREVYSRHARWARLRRATFPAHYAPEIMNGSFVAVLSGAYAAFAFGLSPLIAAFVIVLALYVGELLLAKRCGFTIGRWTPCAMVVRDLLLPVMFIDGLFINDFVWHGEEMTVRENKDALSLR